MSDLDFLFHPRSVAVVGAPRDPADLAGGANFLDALTRFGYKGELYPVNPKASEIMGLRSYPDVISLPQAPDYVICCLPAALTPRLIADCAEKRVKAVSIYTAGFSEAGGDGAEMEQQLVSLAQQGGVRIIGPNCMGIYCPGAGLSYQSALSTEAGSVGVVCQSGGNSNVMGLMGRDRGIRFSKMISYGNAADLNEADFLEYLTQDVETTVIAAYIEAPRAGPRFFRALANAARTKPVIMLKGGRTAAGTRAATSHTGSLATPGEKWDALCQQAGAMQVFSLDEVLDVVEAALYMKAPGGPRVGVVGWGGGASVMGADACESAGLRVPGFSTELKQKLARFALGPGSSVTNPVDSPAVANPSLLAETMRIVSASNEVDVLLVQLPLDVTHLVGDSLAWDAARDAVLETGKSLDFPMAVVQPRSAHPESSAVFHAFKRRCIDAGLPLYAGIGQAADAISRYVEYHMCRQS